MPRFKPVSVAILASLALGGPGVAHALAIESTSIPDGQWLAHTASLTLSFDAQPDPLLGPLHFFLGQRDVSALFRQIEPRVFMLEGSRLPLPSGETELIVFQAHPQLGWQEIGRLPLRVLTPSGMETVQTSATLNLNLKAQLDEGHSGDAIAPDPRTFQDMSGQLSLAAEGRRDGVNAATRFNLFGSSRETERLRFNELGEDAAPLDLSDYVFSISHQHGQFNLGHINYGNNRYLLSHMASRGVQYQHRLGERWDVSLSSMNGSNIVGYENFIGLADSSHNITAATLGYELLASGAANLRAEVMYLDAALQPLSNFDAGEIPDAETSTGVGLSLSGSDGAGRLRGELTYARSRYFNPNDPLLAQGDTLTQVEVRTDNARQAQLSYMLLQNLPVGGQTFSLNASAGYERVDPFYKSLGIFTNANQENRQYGLAAQLGQISLQFNYLSSEDNLDNLDTILKTRTRSNDYLLSLPLAVLFGDARQAYSAWPVVQLRYNLLHQFGANLPISFDPLTHIPDQRNTQQDLALRWNFERWDLSYQFSHSYQDNRQPGRALADFLNQIHNLNLGWRVTDSFGLNLGVGRTSAFSYEANVANYNDSYSIGLNWQISPRWAFTGNYGNASSHDSVARATSDNYTAQSQLVWQFELPAGGGVKLPGQLFVSHALVNNTSRDNLFGFDNQARSWTINSGINLSF